MRSAAILALLVAAPAAQAPSKGKSAATITAAFSNSCRSFAARSSKDISHVEIHYVSGLAVKDETINSHDYAVQGGVGEEIAFADVKSGTTIEEFSCVPSNAAPTALLEINTPPIDQTHEGCLDFWFGGLLCERSSPRTAWTNNTQVPDNGGSDSGLLDWGCGLLTHPSLCSPVMIFRLTGSSDPDGDLASWTLDFGDGTSVSGDWSTGLPATIAHDYSRSLGFGVVTLTVTDSAGQSDTDVIRMVFVDMTPD